MAVVHFNVLFIVIQKFILKLKFRCASVIYLE